jgi:phage protein D
VADLNTLPVVPTVRQPRGAVKLNGTIVVGWETWEVDNNRYQAADTFRVTFPMASLPAGFGIDWFASQASIMVEIFGNEAPADPSNYAPAASDSQILGQTDHIAIDMNAREIELSGRDLTAKLIDTKTSENHQNATSSQVATILATREGLTPVVTATTTRIGQYYEIDHTDLSQQRSEWDLLTKLAEYEGFDVFVVGKELHFGPKTQDTGSRYAIVWTEPTDDSPYPTANATTLSFSRDLTIAKGVSVEVRSWNAKQKKAFTAAWPKNVRSTRPGQASNNNLTYHFTIPGLTQDQASLRAQQLYNQIVQHMISMEASMPADRILNCSIALQVRGTGTALDQVYYPDSVKRSMSVSEGYRMTVSAKNVSQDIEAADQS